VLSSENDPVKPVLALYSDGGSDHRVTYESVRLSLVLLFRDLDLDMLIAFRTAPGHSWVNPAERCMSLLNLGLQGVSLSRSKMSDEMEKKARNANSMSQLRAKVDSVPELKVEYAESMDRVLAQLKNRFRQLQLKGEAVITHDAATEDEVQNFMENARDLDNSIDQFTKKEYKLAKDLAKFQDKHCVKTHDGFQIRKCVKDPCEYCVAHPPKLSEEELENLHFIPCPKLDKDGKYLEYDQIYGKGDPADEKDRPSLTEKIAAKEQKDRDKEHAFLNKEHARMTVNCGECDKPRVLFSVAVLKDAEKVTIKAHTEEIDYVCGQPLFIEEHVMQETVVVKEGLTCQTPVQPVYYSSGYQAVCAFCGEKDSDEMVENEEIADLKRNFQTVHPICYQCYGAHKPITWGPKAMLEENRQTRERGGRSTGNGKAAHTGGTGAPVVRGRGRGQG
jgi:hypothetical protein